MRIKARRRVGRLTSVNPAAVKMLTWPTWSSPHGHVAGRDLNKQTQTIEGAPDRTPGAWHRHPAPGERTL
jgi:hypothetical protein